MSHSNTAVIVTPTMIVHCEPYAAIIYNAGFVGGLKHLSLSEHCCQISICGQGLPWLQTLKV